MTSPLRAKKGALVERLARRRALVQAALDAFSWAASLFVSALLRYDFNVNRLDAAGIAVIVPLAIEAQVISGYLFGLYRGRWRFGSFDEVQALAKTVLLTTTLIFTFDLLLVHDRAVPLSSAIASGPLALVLMAGARYGWRLRIELPRRPTGDECTRLLVFGAGEGGAQVLTAMLRDPQCPYYPVGLLDDDPAKRDLRIMGVRVVGGRHHIKRAAEQHRAEHLLIAIPSASPQLVSELSDLAAEAGLAVRVLPPVRDLFGEAGMSGIRDIDVKDFLGRHQVESDLDSIAGYLTGKRVLVTGAGGGSIGSELCRQILRFGPAELIMLDRSEVGLHGVQLSLEGRPLLNDWNVVLGDICEGDFLRRLFQEHRAEVVFTRPPSSTYPLLERAPGEAIKTNVGGTPTVLEDAAELGVERFLNISTDKAADPLSVLGYTKRIAERLTAHFAEHSQGTFLSVRFGNVLASNGSVLTTFAAQLQAGGPLTVTDPEATRYGLS